MKYFLPILSFFLFSQTSISQTIIEGKAPFLKNKSIALEQFIEYISNSKEAITSTKIDAQGNFKITTDQVKGTRLMDLSSDQFSGSLYVQENQHYTVELIPVDSMAQPVFKHQSMYVKIVAETGDSLNYWVDKILTYYDSALYVTRFDLLGNVKPPSNRTVKKDSVSFQFSKRNKLPQNPYLNDFLVYSQALYELDLGHPYKKIYDQYIKGKKVLVENDGYMFFFTGFYAHFLKKIDRKQQMEIEDVLKSKKNDSLLIAVIQNTGFSEEEYFYEWILLKLIYDYHDYPAFDAVYFNALLENLSTTAHNNEVRVIAKILLNATLKNAEHTPIPKVEVINEKNKRIAISANEKPLYVFFWATWCQSCLKEMSMLEQLCINYKDYVDVIAISLDNDEKTYHDFVKSGTFSFSFPLYYYHDYQLIKEFDVQGVPKAFMVSKENLFLESPSKLPSESVEKSFFDIKAQKDQEILDAKKKKKTKH